MLWKSFENFIGKSHSRHLGDTANDLHVLDLPKQSGMDLK